MEISSDNNQVELGLLLLSEQPQNNYFSPALGEFLFLHRFHQSEPHVLLFCLTAFLASFQSIDHPNYPIVQSTVLDVQKSHLTLVVTVKSKINPEISSLLSFTFCLGSLNPFDDAKFGTALSQTNQMLADRDQVEFGKILMFKYDLTSQYSQSIGENIYQVTRTSKTFQKTQKLLPAHLPFPEQEKMPTINIQTLDFYQKNEKNGQMSILDILALYFSAQHFASTLRQLNITLKAQFLIRAVHGVIAGHFGQILQVTSVTSLNIRNQLTSIALHSEAFCDKAPVILGVNNNPKNGMVFKQNLLPATSDFVAASDFLSVKVDCDPDSHQCMWRTKIQEKLGFKKPETPYDTWKTTDTESFLSYLKHELENLPLKHVLGPFLHGFLASDKFSQLFTERLVFIPGNTKLTNYFSFFSSSLISH